MRKKIAALLLILSCLGSAEAQKRRSHPDPERFSDTAEVYSRLESVPPFGIYKDNYFVTGSSFSGGKLTKNNSDAKFQISIRHRLIKGVLPFHTYLFLTYTQKSFWDIYKKSKPFAESNYNPTLGLGHSDYPPGQARGTRDGCSSSMSRTAGEAIRRAAGTGFR